MAAAKNNNLVDTDPLSSEESSDEEEDQPAFLNCQSIEVLMIYLGISTTYLDEMNLKKTKFVFETHPMNSNHGGCKQ